MPPLDLDAMLVSGDDGVACGGVFLDGSCQEEDPYAPAESLRLRIGEDIDWSDVAGGAGAAVLQRDDSTKGAGANPKSAARRSVAAAARSSMSTPRKVVPAVVIGGLPPAAAGHKVRCSPCRLGGGGGTRVFAAGEQKAVGSRRRHLEEEPGSPKVSCLGAVRAEQRPAGAAAGRGKTSRRRASWRSWFAALLACCFSSRRCARRASKGNEADD